jgi:hypothetical protein
VVPSKQVLGEFGPTTSFPLQPVLDQQVGRLVEVRPPGGRATLTGLTATVSGQPTAATPISMFPCTDWWRPTSLRRWPRP